MTKKGSVREQLMLNITARFNKEIDDDYESLRKKVEHRDWLCSLMPGCDASGKTAITSFTVNRKTAVELFNKLHALLQDKTWLDEPERRYDVEIESV